MNRRTYKLLKYVTHAIVNAEMPTIPKGNPLQLHNPVKNLQRKLKREWNRKPWNIRNGERLGLIRTLVAMEAEANV